MDYYMDMEDFYDDMNYCSNGGYNNFQHFVDRCLMNYGKKSIYSQCNNEKVSSIIITQYFFQMTRKINRNCCLGKKQVFRDKRTI
ncbi:hypothetical protein BLA29_002582 [Euroglyphus maynei]|uniref:Uncharacterized protein n=1 Tax=Euroglyphus maynei TaxID=6958 RepID=A0A1Y3BN79_EURMA|nr:hypothetical protein BLA29_002582 [Euroglyphus maynei]